MKLILALLAIAALGSAAACSAAPKGIDWRNVNYDACQFNCDAPEVREDRK